MFRSNYDEENTKLKLGAKLEHTWRFHGIAILKPNLWKSLLSIFICGMKHTVQDIYLIFFIFPHLMTNQLVD